MKVFFLLWAWYCLWFSFLSEVSLLSVVLLSFACALFFSLVVVLPSRFLYRKTGDLFSVSLLAGILMAIGEFVKDRLFGGVSWVDLYGFLGMLYPLNMLSNLFGPYYLSFLAVLGLFLFYSIFSPKERVLKGLLIFLAFNFLLGFGLFLHRYSMVSEGNSGIFVGVIQPGVSHLDKIDTSQGDSIWENYLRLVGSNDYHLDVIVLPETMAIFSWPGRNLSQWVERLKGRARADTVILGANTYYRGRYYNAAVFFDEHIRTYFKNKLVPFGEYAPAKWLLGDILYRYLDVLPNSEFAKGDGPAVFEVSGRDIMPLICYEDSFIYLIRNYLSRLDGRPSAIVTLSNDEWFGKGLAQWFHLNFARLSAITFSLPIVKANNDAWSCVIDPLGRVVQGEVGLDGFGIRRLFVFWLMDYNMPGGLYQRYGDSLMLLIILVCGIIIIFRVWNKRRWHGTQYSSYKRT